VHLTRVHGRPVTANTMAVTLQRSVEFSMMDMAKVAYYPSIYDLAHRFFESAWEEMCGVSYVTMITERSLGFPVVKISSEFHAPLRYGDVITAHLSITHLGTASLGWSYRFENQEGSVVWTSQQTTVCVNMETMKKQAIPEDLRKGLSEHSQGSE